MVKHLFQGLGVVKDLNKAAYWLLRWGLSKNAKAINLPLNEYFDLVHLIPQALRASPEFNKVAVIELSKFPAEANGQMGAVFAELIKTNGTLTSLKAPTYSIDDAEALTIMEALDSNITLNDIV